MSFEDVSIIVPYTSSSKDREEVWEFVSSMYNIIMPNIEICIGECESDIYNRSKAINNGVKKSTKKILIITDSDIVLDLDSIKKAIRLVETHKIVLPYDKLIKLSKNITQKILLNYYYNISNIKLDTNCEIYTHPKSSICVIDKKLFKQVGGFDEEFRGWGCEDVAFYRSLMYVNKYIYVMKNYNIYHLYHDHNRDYKSNYNLMKNENRLMEYYGKDTIMNTILDLQNINKFS